MYFCNLSGCNTVIISVIIGILLANILDARSQKMVGNAFVIIAVILFTMELQCAPICDRPVGIDPYYNPYC